MAHPIIWTTPVRTLNQPQRQRNIRLDKGVSDMSDCLHCDIHELLESRLQDKETNLEEIAAKVTEVLADLILMVPPDQQSMLMADILVNLGNFLVEKKETSDPTNPRCVYREPHPH
jgi:hypothetical protein